MIEKAVLLLTATALSTQQYPLSQLILPVLVTLSALSLNEFFRKRRLSAMFLVGITLLGLYFPSLLLYLPLLTYDYLRTDRWDVLAVVVFLPAALLLPNAPQNSIVAFMTICLLSEILRQRGVQHRNIMLTLRRQRDDFTEQSQRLEQRLRRTVTEQARNEKNAQLDERSRIAREIHDGVGHRLSSALLQIGALRIVTQAQPDTAELIDALHGTLEEAMNAIRTSVHDLRDQSVSLYDSIYALRDTLGGCTLELRYDLSDPPPPAMAHTMLAIVREALANVMRHSDATAVQVVIAEHPALYQLIITDNGTQKPKKSFDAGSGMGLENIRARATAFGGSADFRYEKGFRVFVSLRRDLTDAKGAAV